MLTVNGKQMLLGSGGAEASLVFNPVGQVENPDPTGSASEIATAAMALPETYDEQAYTDTRLRLDVDSIKGYCDRSEATHVKVVDGDFSTASNWYRVSDGSENKPGAGAKILIPPGITCVYDQNDDTEYDWIRVDGEWSYDLTADRKIVVDTIFVDHTGTYKIGDKVGETITRLDAARTIEIEFPDNGDLVRTDDPLIMHRGFICFGQALIFGAVKTPFARADGDIAQSATSVTLDAAATGWEVGDEILISGTRLKLYESGTWVGHEDEYRTITNIDNTTPSAPVISWTGGLSYPHPACHKQSTWTAPVSNLTRNIKTYSPDGTLPKHRAHQLFKNKDANHVEYVEARGMGRTYMNHNDATIVPDYSQQWYSSHQGGPVEYKKYLDAGNTVLGTTNITGRYAWHFHRNGANNPSLDPTIFRGLVSVASSGWAFVHHDSHGEMHDCIACDFYGVGFAGEGGGSWGELNGCLASGQRQADRAMKSSDVKNVGNGIGDHGSGFWSNSRPLKIKNCIACNVQDGFAWTSRVSFDTDVYPSITDHPEAFYGSADVEPVTEVSKAFAVIEGFENNESIGCFFGGSVAKKQPVQHHSLRSFLNGFKAWEVDHVFHTQYTSGYSMKDFHGVGFNSAWRSGSPNNPGAGMQVFRQSADMVLIEPIMDTFSTGISYTKVGGENFDTNLEHVLISPTFIDCTKDIAASGDIITLPWSNYDNEHDDVIEVDVGDLGAGGVDSIVHTYNEDQCFWDGVGNFAITAASSGYTDSVGYQERYSGMDDSGTIPTTQAELTGTGKLTKERGVIILINKTQMENLIKQEGYYTSTAGDYVLLIPDVIQDRADGTTTNFYTPCAIRMTQAAFDNLLPVPTNNGALDDGVGGEWEGFDPAGTNGLT